jgi:hypothetical protein
MDDKSSVRAKRVALTEASEVTGDKESKITTEEKSNLIELRRLAGLN